MASKAARNASTRRLEASGPPPRGGRRSAAGAPALACRPPSRSKPGIERPEPVRPPRRRARSGPRAGGGARRSARRRSRPLRGATPRRPARRRSAAPRALGAPDLGLGLPQDPLLDGAALGVDGVELGGDLPARAGSSQSSSSSPASARLRRPAALIRGARRKPSVEASSALGSTLGDRHQRAQPGPAGDRQGRAVPRGPDGGSRPRAARGRRPWPAPPARGPRRRVGRRAPGELVRDRGPAQRPGTDSRTRPGGRSGSRAARPSARGAW